MSLPPFHPLSPRQVRSSWRIRPARQEQLTWPWWVSRHSSWQPPVLMRHGESSPEARKDKELRLFSAVHTQNAHTHLHRFTELLDTGGLWHSGGRPGDKRLWGP